jgi:hypothetical protein
LKTSDDECVPVKKPKGSRGNLHQRSFNQLECPDSESDSSYQDSNRDDVEEDLDESENDDDDEEESEEDETDNRMKRLFPGLVNSTPAIDSLARKRKIKMRQDNLTRPPTTGKKKNVGGIDPTMVSPHVRITEFPNESFFADGNNLRCRACGCQIMKKISNVRSHSKCASHVSALQKLTSSKIKESEVLSLLCKRKPEYGIGSKTELNTDVHRLQTCYMFLNESLPFSKLETSEPNSLRNALETEKGTLPRRQVVDYVPQCLELEINSWQGEISKDGKVTIFFDGTCNVCEMMNIVIRFISRDKKICHRLASLRLLKSSLNGEGLFVWLVATLFGDLKFSHTQIACLVRDGCQVNSVAAEKMALLNPKVLDITCLSHATSVAGYTLNKDVPLAAKFISKWANLISHCIKARLKFREFAHQSALRLAKVRWFSFCEVATQLHKCWSAVLATIDEENDFAVDGREALRSIVANDSLHLRLEIALVADIGKPLINFCYLREGDGFLAPTTYDHWLGTVRDVSEITKPNNPICPCVEEVLEEFVGTAGERKAACDLTIAKGANVLLKLEYDGMNRLHVTLGIMRGCRLFDYAFVANTPTPTVLEEMHHLNRLPDCIPILEALRINYLSIKQFQVQKPEISRKGKWKFWVANMLTLSNWFLGAVIGLLRESVCNGD